MDTNEIDYKALGKKVREVRLQRNMTQCELAELVGISSNHVANIESANARLSLAVFFKIANVLNIPLDYLAEESLTNKHLCTDYLNLFIFDGCNELQTHIIFENALSLKKSLLILPDSNKK